MTITSFTTSLPGSTSLPHLPVADRAAEAHHEVQLAPCVAAAIDDAAVASGTSPAAVVLRALEQVAAALWPDGSAPVARCAPDQTVAAPGSGCVVDAVVAGTAVSVSTGPTGVLVEVTAGVAAVDPGCVRLLALGLVVVLGELAR